MPVPMPLIGTPIPPKAYSSQRIAGPEPVTIARDRSLQPTKGTYRLVMKKTFFFGLICRGF